MKLLSPAQAKDVRGQEIARDLLRAKETDEIIRETNMRQAKAEADFNSMLAGQRLRWAVEEKEHADRKEEMEQEITVLELKRKEALVPVQNLRKEAEAKRQEAEDFLVALKEREQITEELTEKLEIKLDSVGAREQDLIQREKTILSKEKGIEEQAALTIEGNRNLNERVAKFSVEKQEAEKAFEEKRKELFLFETSLSSKDDVLKDKEKRLEEKDAEIKKASEKLDAKRKEALIPVETLKKEAEELRNSIQLALYEAESKRETANYLVAKAERDYKLRLEELDGREAAIKTGESRIFALKAELEIRSADVSKTEKNLEMKILGYEASKKELDKSWKDFESEKIKQEELVQGKLQESEQNKREASDILVRASQKEENAKLLHGRLDGREKFLASEKNKIIAEQKGLALENIRILELKKTTENGMSELDKDREAFSMWRSEAEKIVEDKAMDNSRRHSLLSEREKKVKRQEKFLADWAVRLKDERGILDRAWKELERKKMSP